MMVAAAPGSEAAAVSAAAADQVYPEPPDQEPPAGGSLCASPKPPPTGGPSSAKSPLDPHEPAQKSTEFQRFRPGVAYYGYRWLDPATGRWPSRDPIGEMGGINLYGFVENDGVDKWDVLGRVPVVEPDSTIPPVLDLPFGREDPPGSNAYVVGQYHNGGIKLRIKNQDGKKCCIEAKISFGINPPLLWVDSGLAKRLGHTFLTVAMHETFHASAMLARLGKIADELIQEQECYDSENDADTAIKNLSEIYNLKIDQSIELEARHDQSGGFGTPLPGGFD